MHIIETNLNFSELEKRSRTNRTILHHSGVTVLQTVETIHNYHKNTNGWAGIGYHFYVRKDGNIYRGRPIDTIGAHARGNNSDSIGICFEGDFNEETMNDVQKEAGKWLVAYLKEKYKISVVQAHRDVNNTSCPGKNLPFDEIVNVKVVQDEETRKEEGEDEEVRIYQNGSTKETIYADTNCTKEIGYLSPREKCDCLGIFENRAMVRYKVDNANNYKIGFAKWLGGVK